MDSSQIDPFGEIPTDDCGLFNRTLSSNILDKKILGLRRQEAKKICVLKQITMLLAGLYSSTGLILFSSVFFPEGLHCTLPWEAVWGT